MNHYEIAKVVAELRRAADALVRLEADYINKTGVVEE